MARKRSRHDAKRAARFADAGIDVADLAFAHATYMGEGEDACCLCDTRIKYCFCLTFRGRPGKPDVVMRPVGSQCITDWMRALPACPERDAALARVKDAKRECNRLKREKKEEERRQQARASCLEAFENGDADLMRRYFALCDGGKAEEFHRWDVLTDIGGRAERFRSFSSSRQRNFFAVLVREAEEMAMGPEEKQAALVERVSEENPDHGRLMARYYAVPTEYRCDTLRDIADGVERFGHFRTDRQARFFAVKLRDAEAKVPAPMPTDDDEPINPVQDACHGDDVLSVAKPENMDDFPW